MQDELVQQVADGPTFSKAPALRRLLRYLWMHREEPPGEYAIAIDVLGKQEDFDPKIDASVRVQVSRLRARLKEYFEGEGSSAAFRLVIRPGSMQLLLESRPEIAEPSPIAQLVKRWGVPVAFGILLILLAALLVHNRTVSEDLARARQGMELPPIWRGMLKEHQITRILFPVPVFYAWGELRVRDVRNNTPEGWIGSPRLQPLVEMFGKPEVSQSYSVSSDMMGAIQLTRFLSSHGIPLEVAPINDLLLNQYGRDNLIFLGMPQTNANLAGHLSRTNFYLSPNDAVVYNRNPRPGEKAAYVPSGKYTRSGPAQRYGLIAVLPAHAAGTRLILIMGLQTSALSTFLSSTSGIEKLTQAWHEAQSPEYFEMVVSTEGDGFSTKSAEIVAFRKFS